MTNEQRAAVERLRKFADEPAPDTDFMVVDWLQADLRLLLSLLAAPERATVARMTAALKQIAKVGCMDAAGAEFWCKTDGSAHSCYCPAGIAKGALEQVEVRVVRVAPERGG